MSCICLLSFECHSLTFMNRTTDSVHNPMRKEDIGLDFLIAKVIISPGRDLPMKHNRLLPDLLLEVSTKLLLTSGWTHQKGRINHKCLFMVGLFLMDLKNHLSCPLSTLMTLWVGLSCYLWMKMGRGRELPYLIISIILIKLKFS